jgi:hypothetical protein
MTYAELLAAHSGPFWAFIYFAWGAAYSCIVTSAVLLSVILKKRKKLPAAEVRFTGIAQFLWAVVHLPGVFAVPVLIGTISPTVMIEGEYMWLMGIGWALGLGLIYFLVRPFWRIDNLTKP